MIQQGFSPIGQVLEDIKNKLNNIFDDYISNKDMIHCFLYFLNGSIKRTFDENEIELIKYIHDKQKSYFSFSKIFFIINFTNKNDEKDIDSFKNLVHDDLEQKFGKYSESSKTENIIEINLKRDIKENREEKFGLDEIFTKMFECFRNYKISIENKII